MGRSWAVGWVLVTACGLPELPRIDPPAMNDGGVTEPDPPPQPPGPSLELFAGQIGGRGDRDAERSDARFFGLRGVALAADGRVFVADTANHTIRVISQEGRVTTLAGVAGESGSSDGVGSLARFFEPAAIALDGAGNAYVADTGNQTIRKISTTGQVTTLAGAPGLIGSRDGAGPDARFSYPAGLAADLVGNVYVADTWNHTIRRITPQGHVSTLAGSPAQFGSEDGLGANAHFYRPESVAAHVSGDIYVADTQNHTIRKVTSSGIVTTVAGTAGLAGTHDAVGSAARFFLPAGIAVAPGRQLYVAEPGSHLLRWISPTGAVSTLAGAGVSGATDAQGVSASFFEPRHVAVDAQGAVLVADTGNHVLRRCSALGDVTTFAGAAAYPQDTSGVGILARFRSPRGVTTLGGDLVVTDALAHTVRKLSSSGEVTTWVGSAGAWGAVDGAGSTARFFRPTGLAADALGQVFVADQWNHTIRKISSTGTAAVYAGIAGSRGSTSGAASIAQFHDPSAVAVGSDGALYVADTGNHTIRKISAGVTPQVSTLAGAANASGTVDGSGAVARFAAPEGIAVDGAGSIYVADTGNHTIRKISGQGEVTTLAGAANMAGVADGVGSAARFRRPRGMAVDGAGNLYVADRDNGAIRKVTPRGEVTTLAGTPGIRGIVLGQTRGLAFPESVTIVGDSLFVVDSAAVLVLRGAAR